MSQDGFRLLKQEFESRFTFTRSTGPVVGRFLTGLQDRRILGIVGSDGRVLVPPLEYDPNTFAALKKFVEVEQTGVVTSWCWVKKPREKHLFNKPFAFALILLDGADTPMFHMVDAADESAMATGMRVRARWAAETKGHITDIECFEPGQGSHKPSEEYQVNEEEMVTGIDVPIRFKYNFTAGAATTRFLMKIKEGKIVGQRCPSCSNIYVPPRGCCAKCGVVTQEEVELPPTGIIESFTIVHIPIPDSPIEPPIISANIILDGADIAFMHLLSEVDPDKVQIGMRVEAVWKPQQEWGYTFENIAWFRPVERS